MPASLRTRLAVAFAVVALLAVAAVGVLANLVLERAFQRYVTRGIETSNRELAALVDRQRLGGRWDLRGLEGVGLAALESGVVLRVVDADGAVAWDANEHNSGLCRAMLDHMAANTSRRYPAGTGAYTEASFPLAGGGSLTVGYWGPFFLDDEDLAFLATLNRLLLAITAAVLLPAGAAGALVARRITRPLDRVVAATRRIADGDRAVRVEGGSRIRELDRIGTAVNELSRALDEQENLRQRLTADVAHELRTPLATLQSHLEALLDGVWEPDRRRLGGLHEEVTRLNRLVGDLERLARLESAAVALERRDTDVTCLVAGIVRNHEAAFREAGVTLVGPATASGLHATVDPDRLSQAVINLVANALEFTPRGGTVELAVARSVDGVAITVRDTGVGIPAEDLPRVFERFYRVDASRSRVSGGTGVGLTIARAIVEAHGGTLRAASAPGRGSTFTVSLPA